jgi:hypothetical protein
MRRTLVGISILAFGALSTGACGGDSDGGISGGKSIPIEDVGPLYGDALCTAYETCSAGAPLVAFLNGEDCRKNFETAFDDEMGRIKTAIDDGRVVYKGDLIQGCIDAIKKSSCGLNEEPPECKAAVVGTVDDGGACTLDAECKGGSSYCRVEASCPGMCAPKEPAGASCKRNDDCATGLQCSETTDKCFKPAGDGDACGGGSAPECGPWMFCLGEDEDAQKSGTCAEGSVAFAGNDGDDCWVDGKPLCKDGLHCVLSADVSAGKLVGKCGKPLAAGAACNPALPDACPIDEFCKLAPNTFDGTCSKKPGANEPCGPGLGDSDVCATDTRCDGGTCRPRQKLGGSCSDDAVCYSENCSGGACAPGGGCTN